MYYGYDTTPSTTTWATIQAPTYVLIDQKKFPVVKGYQRIWKNGTSKRQVMKNIPEGKDLAPDFHAWVAMSSLKEGGYTLEGKEGPPDIWIIQAHGDAWERTKGMMSNKGKMILVENKRTHKCAIINDMDVPHQGWQSAQINTLPDLSNCALVVLASCYSGVGASSAGHIAYTLKHDNNVGTVISFSRKVLAWESEAWMESFFPKLVDTNGRLKLSVSDITNAAKAAHADIIRKKSAEPFLVVNGTQYYE
jgi:hypothetical protein